jgi:hypothetical protein
MKSKCTPILKVALVQKLWMFRALVERANQWQIEPQDIIRKVLKCRCLKGLLIVHLDVIDMSHDKKKGQESNWEFDSWSQIPTKQGSNKIRLGHVIHHWKIFLKAIRYYLAFSKQNWFEKNMNGQSFGTTKVLVLGLPLGNHREKWHLDVVPIDRHTIYYKEGNGASFQRLEAVWSLCLKLSLLNLSHHFHSTCTNHVLSWLYKLISS